MINEEEAAIVRKIFSWYLEGYGVNKIIKELSNTGVKFPKGSDKWSKRTIQNMLVNETYIGNVLLGKTCTGEFPDNKQRINRGQVQQYLMKEVHTLLIASEIFEKVQVELKRRSNLEIVNGKAQDKGSLDLRRFRAYEALLSHQTNKDVETYVIYSNGITTPMTSLKTGFNNYRVKTVTLADKNVNEIFDVIKEKLNKGTEITKQEVIALAFTPIMGGSMSKQEKIIKAIRMTMTIDKEYRYDVQSILYAFANKFLEGKELEDVKEELKMTELGKSLIKEGREEGIEEGKKKKAIETAQEAINMGLEDEKIIKLTGLTIEELKLLKEMA